MVLAIYCAGGLGKEVLSLARYVNAQTGRWDSIFFVDDVTDDSEYDGVKIYRFKELAGSHWEIEFVIANGEPEARMMLSDKIEKSGYGLGTLIDPRAMILQGAKIGEGCIIYVGAIISADVVIGKNVHINADAIIGHDTVVGDGCNISARAFIGGHTKIEDNVHLAPCCLIKDRVTVRRNAIISLGAVVLRHVKDSAIMVGNPAECIGYNTGKTVFNRF